MPPRADNPYENWTITLNGEEEIPVARFNNEPIHGTLNNEVVENVFTGTVDDDGDATFTARNVDTTATTTTITNNGGWVTTTNPNIWTMPNTTTVNTDWFRDGLNATTLNWDYAFALETIESVEEAKEKKDKFKDEDRVKISGEVLYELLERIEELEELNMKLEKYANAELAEEWEKVMKSES